MADLSYYPNYGLIFSKYCLILVTAFTIFFFKLNVFDGELDTETHLFYKHCYLFTCNN